MLVCDQKPLPECDDSITHMDIYATDEKALYFPWWSGRAASRNWTSLVTCKPRCLYQQPFTLPSI